MTAPFNIPEGYQELIPRPSDDDALLPGDEVWLVYDLLFGIGGDWLIGTQISEIEKKLEEDKRFLLLSWSYDRDNAQVWFRLRVNENTIEPAVQQANAGVVLLATIALLETAIIGIMYYIYRRYDDTRVMRKAERAEAYQASNLPQPVKDELIRQELQGVPERSGLAALAGPLLLVGIGLLVLSWVKR